MATRRTAFKATLTPIPAFDPVERPVLLGVILLDWLVGVGEDTIEDLAAGLAAKVVAEPAAAVFSDSRRRLMMSVSVTCHRTWIRSAQTVLPPAGISVCVTVSREGEVGSGPGDSDDVEKTLVRSVPMRLMQAKSTIGWLLVE